MVNGQGSLPRLGRVMRKRGDPPGGATVGAPRPVPRLLLNPALEPSLTLLVSFQKHFNRVESNSYSLTLKYVN